MSNAGGAVVMPGCSLSTRPGLVCGNNEAGGVEGAGSDQGSPLVKFSGAVLPRRWNNNNLSTQLGKVDKLFGEADVVANSHADTGARGVEKHQIGAGSNGVRFAVTEGVVRVYFLVAFVYVRAGNQRHVGHAVPGCTIFVHGVGGAEHADDRDDPKFSRVVADEGGKGAVEGFGDGVQPPTTEGTHSGLGKNNKLGALSNSGIHAGDDVGQILHCVHT